MVIKLPQFNWSQPNTSDKFGDLWATKNINLDEAGYIKLSPRAIKIFDETAGFGDVAFGVPVGIGQDGIGSFQIGTTDEFFNLLFSALSFSVDDNTESDAPEMVVNSHSRFFDGRVWASENDKVTSKAANAGTSGNWTDSGVSLTGSVRHYIEPFVSKGTLCVTNGNVVRQYTASSSTLSASNHLTLPADYETLKLAYNSGLMGIITGTGSAEGRVESIFFVWNGGSASTDVKGYGIGSTTCLDIVAYKSSFVILTRAGELKYFNGGGFDTLAVLPFYTDDKLWGSDSSNYPAGSSMTVDGDVILINIGGELNEFGRKEYVQIPNFPSGVWCYDPALGTKGSLYHRFSPSISPFYLASISAAQVNSATNVFTTGVTIPSTGNIARVARFADSGVGGLTLNQDYYIIKLSETTFSLAETKADAEAGTAIDITSTDDVTFCFYDLIDFSNTYHSDTGALTLFGDATALNRDVIFGGDYAASNLDDTDSLCMIVPYLENRGYFILSKMFSDDVTDNAQKVYIKHRLLTGSNKIVVKSKTFDIEGLPISAPNAVTGSEFTWSNNRVGYTSSDLSAALTAFNEGNELEMEIVAGVGGGTCVKVDEIRYDNGTYVLTMDEDVIGAAYDLKSYFILDHWVTKGVIDANSETNKKGYAEIQIGEANGWVLVKVEMQGVDIAIGGAQIINSVDKSSE